MYHESNLGKRHFIGAMLGLGLLGLEGLGVYFGSSALDRASRPVASLSSSPIEITLENFSQQRLEELTGKRVVVRGWIEFAWRALSGQSYFIEEDRVRLSGLGHGPYLHIMRSGLVNENGKQADQEFIGQRALVEGTVSTKDVLNHSHPAFLLTQSDPTLLSKNN